MSAEIVESSATTTDVRVDGGDPIRIWKTPWMVERYLALAEEFRGGTIVELGVHRGGSTRLLTLVYEPRALLAVDINPSDPRLDEFVASDGRAERVRVAWETDQADSARLRALLDETIAAGPLDLVIDDASHLHGPTRQSFQTLFPRLRPGGLLIMEDWSHDHRVDHGLAAAIASDPTLAARFEDELREAAAPTAQAGPPPLSVLLIELVIVAAGCPDVVASVDLRQGWAEIRRGDAALDDDFELTEHLGPAGRRLMGQIAP